MRRRGQTSGQNSKQWVECLEATRRKRQSTENGEEEARNGEAGEKKGKMGKEQGDTKE